VCGYESGTRKKVRLVERSVARALDGGALHAENNETNTLERPWTRSAISTSAPPLWNVGRATSFSRLRCVSTASTSGLPWLGTGHCGAASRLSYFNRPDKPLGEQHAIVDHGIPSCILTKINRRMGDAMAQSANRCASQDFRGRPRQAIVQSGQKTSFLHQVKDTVREIIGAVVERIQDQFGIARPFVRRI
jgi:hypothetical protein